MNDVVREFPERRARRRSMADRVRLLRHQGFVGRVAQRRAFASALRGEHDAPRVLFVHGPGGIGKSALLRRLADDAEDLGHTVAWVSGEYVLASTTAFAEAASPVRTADRPVLVVDGFEHCQVLETWLREHFLPTVPENTVVVVAGRQRPEPNWTLDPGWRRLVRVISLEPLNRDEVADLLDDRGVPGALHSAVNDFAGGYPLALCLAAETATVTTSLGETTWAPSPDVIETLLARLIDRVPSPAHEYGLRVCAHVRHVTVDLLRTGLDDEDAVAVFDWLSGLPYVEPGPHGLVGHELVRDVLDSSFRWRDPVAYAEVHARMWHHLGERARNASGDAVPVVSSEITYLFRYSDYVRDDIVDAAATEALIEREYTPAMREDLLRLAREDQGDECAALVAHWLDRKPEAFLVYCRADDMVPVSLFAWLRLYPGRDELTADPALAVVQEYLDRIGGTAEGDHVGVARFLVPAPSAKHHTTGANSHTTQISAETLRQENGLVATFLVLPNARDFAAKIAWFDYELLRSVPAIGDGRWGVFVHDWREIPLPAHLDRIMPQLGSTGPGPEPARDPAGLMTREQHFEAVKQLLRDWHDGEAVAANPLVRTYGDAGTMREAVTDAVEALADDPRRVNHHRAMRATYLQRATTQEAAAARLGMPFGTYRRHLRSGMDEVCATLWAQYEGSQPGRS